MSGSKKGERRGNARKRPAGSPERPRDVMREAARYKPTGSGKRGTSVRTIEKRIEIARIIHGRSGAVADMTPKEVLLYGMHHYMQGTFDWGDIAQQQASLPPTPERTQLVRYAELELERHLDKAGEFAFKAYPMIHPKLSAVAIAADQGDSPHSIIEYLLEDIDKRQREEPLQIEHQPKKRTA